MTRSARAALFGLAALAFLPAAAAQEGTGAVVPEGEPDADEIVERALDTNTIGFQSGQAFLTLIIQDEHGDLRERRLEIHANRDDDLNRALVRILAPSEVAGQAYLFLENADREDDVWIYLPAIDDAPRRISGSQKDESFLGTNLTYADLESRDIRDGAYTRLPDEEISGFDVYVIDAVAEDSAYASIRLWIRKSDNVPLRIRFFGNGDVVEKTLFTEQIDERQGRTYVRRMTMVDRHDVSTTVVVEAIDFEASFPPTEFTRENLTR